jgi:predicted GNAT family acetyltransferase
MNLRGDITPAFSNTGTGPGEKSALQRALEGILFNSASGIVESTADDAGMVASLAGVLADPSAGALGNATLKAIQQGVEERGIGGVASATDFVPAGMLAGALPLLADLGKVAKKAKNTKNINIVKGAAKDGSHITGGKEIIQYSDPATGSTMEILTRSEGPRAASVLGLFVPEEHRGQGIGKALQEAVLADHPSLMGQVSSKAAAKNAFDAGRRPLDNPNANIEDIFKAIDEYSSVNLATPDTPDLTPRQARLAELAEGRCVAVVGRSWQGSEEGAC